MMKKLLAVVLMGCFTFATAADAGTRHIYGGHSYWSFKHKGVKHKTECHRRH